MTKNELLAALAERDTKIAALEAQLAVARRVYSELKRSEAVVRPAQSNEQVSFWQDSRGQWYRRVKVGNLSRSNPVASPPERAR